MDKRLKKILPFVILTALAIMFLPGMLTGKILFLGDFTGSDLIDQNMPFNQILHEEIINKRFPLWEDELSMGFPVFADGKGAYLYPVNLLINLLNPHWAINASALSTFIISGWGMYLFFKAIKLNPNEAFYGAVIFAFSAFNITRMKHINMVGTAAMLGWSLFLINQYFLKFKKYLIVLNGMVLGMMILGGHIQMAYYNFIGIVGFILFKGILEYKKNTTRAINSIIILISLSFLIAGGVGAVQMIPTVEFLGQTERAQFSETSILAYPYHPKNLITFIAPYYFGNPADGSYQQNIRQIGIFWENSSYIGILPLILAIYWAYLIIRKKKTDKNSLFFLSLGIIAMLLVLGPFTPLFIFLARNIPLFNLFRFPTRFNIFVILALSYLAAKGLGEINKKFKQKYLTWGIIIFSLVDQIIFANDYFSYINKELLTKEPEFIKEIDKNYRIWSLTQYGQSPYSAGWKTNQDLVAKFREAIPPNNNVFWGIKSFSDRAWFEGGLSIKERSRIERFLLNENVDPVILGKILGMYNVGYIIGFNEEMGIEINKIRELDLGESVGAKLNLFKNEQVLEQAYFVPEVVVINNQEEVFKKITSDNEFLPSKTVILENVPQEIPSDYNGVLSEFQEQNKVEIVESHNNEIAIKADIKNHGFLVLSDMYYPGWKALVNGKNNKILKANYMVRAIELWPGEQEIKFYYEPLSVKIGAIVSGLTLFGIIIFFGYRLLRFRK